MGPGPEIRMEPEGKLKPWVQHCMRNILMVHGCNLRTEEAEAVGHPLLPRKYEANMGDM